MRKHIFINDELRHAIRISAAINGRTIKKTVEDSLIGYLEHRRSADVVSRPEVLKYLIGEKKVTEVNISEDLHTQIKTFVAFQKGETSVQQFMVEAIVWMLTEEL